jgi:DNA-binding NtrC family response regulator
MNGGVNMKTVSLLIIEDEQDLRLSIAAYFADLGFQITEAGDGRAGLELFRTIHPALVFTDLRMPVLDGFAVIEAIAQESPDTPIIVISGTGEITDAVRAMRLGARDFVLKPVFELEELELAVKRALNESALQLEVNALKNRLLGVDQTCHPAFETIITVDPVMGAVFRYLEVVSTTSQPIMIQGETGTGKELVASAIHAASGRSGAFVAVNVAGLDEQAFSDTLFGHTRGAFTGADKPREGLIGQASGGTLFLDEIGDLGANLQVKLLRLLQEGEYYPLGSDIPRITNARIVVATHANLQQLVANGQFRQDLYYRLKAHQVTIPPLRDRRSDVPLLLNFFLGSAARQLGRKKPTVPPELLCYLAAYSFPGNIRELQALVFDAVARHGSGVLSMQSFLDAIGQKRESVTPPTGQQAVILLRDAVGERTPTLEEAERLLVAQALCQAGGNQGAAASILGISRNALNKKLIREKLKA